ncbi:RHS repeat-associated core domain-containing protein [Sporocytophaga myxococcoides]|uniref:RHS repeat-associated core domain-containing protein n=1 Tax=Sporocytophaga myxococcoides TaxID=153721 RepID=A0A098LLF7_9BACT|nr:RHS repeat-associated core domain-containing protein [Sporocytophaga myxococcoides]GAL87795.1 RHS repeat-associated core domain-containing protein [Sporocytophaga myxococcoides]
MTTAITDANPSSGTSGTWNGGNDGSYQETFKYDANGNILKLTRNGKLVTSGTTSPLAMDDLTYKYETIANGYTRNTNRLRSVSDAVGNGNYADDIDNQANNNYDYDEIGNLKSDVQEGIATIEWTVSGKISKVTRSSVSSKSDLEFKYDAQGNRLAKIEKPAATKGDASTWITTFYVRDASGNVMSTYEQKKTTTVQEFFLKEQSIYGSTRLGMVDLNKNITTLGAVSNSLFASKTGIKLFEGSNHLGNVLAVFTDRKIPVASGTNVLSYTADITSTSDYYAFGSQMPGRKYTKTNYRYGFNGKEKDSEFHDNYDYGKRVYDARLGKFLSSDPLAKIYPFYSPYQFAGNSPIVNVDIDGEEPFDYRLRTAEFRARLDNIEWEDIATYLLCETQCSMMNIVSREQAQMSQTTKNVLYARYGVFTNFNEVTFKYELSIEYEWVVEGPGGAILGTFIDFLGASSFLQKGPTALLAKTPVKPILFSIPLGFKSFGQFKQFGTTIQAGLAKLGYKNTNLYMQGSSITARSAETGELFDVGRKSDFDLALTGEDIFKKAEELGLVKGDRTGPINLGSEEASKLGISDLLEEISNSIGRDVNVMIFKTVEAIKAKGSSVRVPTQQ